MTATRHRVVAACLMAGVRAAPLSEVAAPPSLWQECGRRSMDPKEQYKKAGMRIWSSRPLFQKIVMKSKMTIREQKLQLNHNWSRPPSGFLKINTDAAFHRDTNSGGWGFVIRDEQGRAMAAGAGNLVHISDALHAEALALLYAIKMAAHMGCDKVLFETDSTQLWRAVNSNEYDLANLGAIIRSITFQLSVEFSSARVVSCPRACNRVAHVLAAYGVNLGAEMCETWLGQLPDFVLNYVMGDLPNIEVWQSGEPKMRPERDRVVIAHTVGMAALEQGFCGRALYAAILGHLQSVVTPEVLAAAMESYCVVRGVATKVEVVCPPFHFFVCFDSKEDCTRVVHVSKQLHCGGSRIGFQCWSRFSHGTLGKLEYKMTLSLEGLPEEACDPDIVNLVLAGVDGKLIDMLPAIDRWVLSITARLRGPRGVPKVLTVFVPAPPLQPWKPISYDENAHSLPPPNSPKECVTIGFFL
uniref:Uncharacterized protein n=1 Tax=Aegilops tauschii TaxID=37682 RepID=M8BSG8_AEGTA